jgi:hypothetical protein
MTTIKLGIHLEKKNDVLSMVALNWIPNSNLDDVRFTQEAVIKNKKEYLIKVINKGCKVDVDILKFIRKDTLALIGVIINKCNVSLEQLPKDLPPEYLTKRLCKYIDINNRNILWYTTHRDVAILRCAKIDQLDNNNRSWINDGIGRTTNDPVVNIPYTWTLSEAKVISDSGNLYHLQEIYNIIPDYVYDKTNSVVLCDLIVNDKHQKLICDKFHGNSHSCVYFRLLNDLSLDSEQTDVALKMKTAYVKIAELSEDKEKVVKNVQTEDVLEAIISTGYMSERLYLECAYKGVYVNALPENVRINSLILKRSDVKTLWQLLNNGEKMPRFNSTYDWKDREEKIIMMVRYGWYIPSSDSLRAASFSLEMFLHVICNCAVDNNHVKCMDVDEACDDVISFINNNYYF